MIEPELGLHPEAVALLAGDCSTPKFNRMQLVVTKHNRRCLLSQVHPDDVITVESTQRLARFQTVWMGARPDGSAQRDYSLGEIWQKGLMDAEVQSIVGVDRRMMIS